MGSKSMLGQHQASKRERKETNMRCVKCLSNGVGRKRASYGHLLCKPCGDEQALKDRAKWTVVQEYGKGCYQFITSQSAPTALKNTNQKQTRGDL